MRSPSRSSQRAPPGRASGTETAGLPDGSALRWGASRSPLGALPSPSTRSQPCPSPIASWARVPDSRRSRITVKAPSVCGASTTLAGPPAASAGRVTGAVDSNTRVAIPARSNRAAGGREANGKAMRRPGQARTIRAWTGPDDAAGSAGGVTPDPASARAAGGGPAGASPAVIRASAARGSGGLASEGLASADLVSVGLASAGLASAGLASAVLAS
ncbi:hypothetical protein HPY23_27445 [Methylobacterium sp. IF7SW-B2]|nr:hypothetical protein [Methylobacterium ajmalii]MBK3411929.1 hypothetical protein [Methylobacterium ajmalii]